MSINIMSKNVLAQDHIGFLSVDPQIGMVFYRTPCCGATAKGSQSGVVCRACYTPVTPDTGLAWMVEHEAAWSAYADRLRPELQEFADRMAAKTRERARALCGKK